MFRTCARQQGGVFVLGLFAAVVSLSSAPGAHSSEVTTRARFLREHVNDLDTLLKSVSVGPYVVFTAYSFEYFELAANWYYSITHFGRVPYALVTTIDKRSLTECMSLGLPCYNGTSLLAGPDLSLNFNNGWNFGIYCKLTWVKAIMVHMLLIRNYAPIISDIDTVWFKDVIRSLAYAIDFVDADAVGMDDNHVRKPNTGNMLFKNNPRTRKLAEAWVGMAYDTKTREFNANGTSFHEQEGLWKLDGIAWSACRNSSECLALKAQGKAAIWLNPWHGCPDQQQPCDPNLAYLHVFCTTGGQPHKKAMAIADNIWFVSSDVQQVHMKGARAWDLINATHHYRFSQEAVRNGSALPCPNEVPVWDLS